MCRGAEMNFRWMALVLVAFAGPALAAVPAGVVPGVVPGGGPGGSAPGGSVLVVNSGEASLSVLDLATHAERGRIAVLREPHHVMLTPDGRELLLGDTVANEMLVLDPASFAIKRRMTMADPYQLGFSPDGKYLVVNGLARAQVDVYDGKTYALVKRFALKSMPSHMAFSPDASMLYVTLQGTDMLAAIDLRHLQVLWTQKVGRTPAGVMWSNGRLLVANMGSDDISVVDPGTGDVLQKVRTGRGAHQIFPSPDGKLIYVNNRVDSTIVVLDAGTLAQVRSYHVPGGPDDLIFTPDGQVWATLRFAAKVAVLDPKSGNFETFPVGRSPHGIFLHVAGQ